MRKNNKLVIYQMFPRLFTNTNVSNTFNGSIEQNGVGKMNDIDGKVLESLKDLGVTHMWYTGVIEHATKTDYTQYGIQSSNPHVVKGNAGSPYAIRDYYDIDPDIAVDVPNRIHEFENLVNRTHDNGMKVIIDFVPNHVAREYHSDAKPSGVEDLGATDDKGMFFSPSNNFFYITGKEFAPNVDLGQGNDRYVEFPAKATGNDCYNEHPGVNDWYETVKINYCDFHTATWDKMLHILKYWLGKGVDGFRCDMVELVPSEFFTWCIAEVKKDYPEALFVAEVYQKSLYQKYVREVGFDLLYDKSGLYDTLSEIVRNENPDFVEPWQSATRITASWQDLGDLQMYMLNFLENHDETRFASEFFGKDAKKCFPALAVSLFMNKAAFMNYFGEETGERGMDAEGFSGRDGRTTIFDWWGPEKVRGLWKLTRKRNYEKAAELFSIKDSNTRKGLLRTRVKSAVQLKALMLETGLNEQELRFFVKYTSLLKFAATDNAITEGMTYDLCYCNYDSEGFDKNRHFVFLRDDHDDTFLIAANFGKEDARMHISIPERAFEWLELEQTENCNATHPVILDVPAVDVSIIRLSSSSTPHPQEKKHNFAKGE